MSGLSMNLYMLYPLPCLSCFLCLHFVIVYMWQQRREREAEAETERERHREIIVISTRKSHLAHVTPLFWLKIALALLSMPAPLPPAILL